MLQGSHMSVDVARLCEELKAHAFRVMDVTHLMDAFNVFF